MKIVFNKSELLNYLSPCMGCISTKSTFTSIEGVYIEAREDNRCVICTYDMEKGMRAEFDAEVIEAGKYIVGAQDFFQYVKILPGSEIMLEVSEKLTAKVSSGKVCYMMHALHGNEFPAFPELFSKEGFLMQSEKMRELIGHTLHSIASIDTNHPELCGGFLNIKRDSVTMVSCDSFTLSKCEMNLSVGAVEGDSEISVIIPGKSLIELNKLISDEEEIFVKPARRHIIFEIGDLIFFTRLIDTKYIDYNRIIQNNLPIEVVVDRAEILSSLDRASLISEKKSVGSSRSYVKLSFKENILKISSNSLTGQIYDEIECEHTGEDLEIGFTCRYLIESLRALDCEKVKMYLKAPRICMILKPEEANEEKELLQMILPVKMAD